MLGKILILSAMLNFMIANALNAQPELNTVRYFHPNSKMLTASKNYFAFYPAESVGNICDRISDVMCNMPDIQQKMIKIFQNDYEYPYVAFSIDFPIWGSIYANLKFTNDNSANIDQTTVHYAIAAIYAKRYNEAIDVLLNLASNNDEDYSLKILLGMLSIHDKTLFPYLEEAFEINPLKTLFLVDWQIMCLDIEPGDEEWDFVENYVELLKAYRKTLDDNMIPQGMAQRLIKTINEKYYDEELSILPEYTKLKSDLSILKRSLERSTKKVSRGTPAPRRVD